jgi:hypothetical protein
MFRKKIQLAESLEDDYHRRFFRRGEGDAPSMSRKFGFSSNFLDTTLVTEKAGDGRLSLRNGW